MNFKALPIYQQTRLALRVIGACGDQSIKALAFDQFYQAEFYRVASHIPTTSEVTTHAVMAVYARYVAAHDRFFKTIIQVCAIATALKNRIAKGGNVDTEVNVAGLELQAYVGENYDCWETHRTKNFEHEKLSMNPVLQGLFFQFLMQFVEETK